MILVYGICKYIVVIYETAAASNKPAIKVVVKRNGSEDFSPILAYSGTTSLNR